MRQWNRLVRPLGRWGSVPPLCMVLAASATTWEFDYRGEMVHQVDQWECGGPTVPTCSPAQVESAWVGRLSLITPEGEGTFQQGVEVLLNGVEVETPFSTVRVGVAGGEVVSLTGQTAIGGVPYPVYSFQGMEMTMGQAHQLHVGETRGEALLVSQVPELPISWWVLGGFILLVGWHVKEMTYGH